MINSVPMIGLNGYARAGKDTVAHILKDYGFEQFSFAARLKEALKRLDPFVNLRPGYRLSQVLPNGGWDYVKDEFPEVRDLLQRMGTEVGRNLFGENFWVDQAMAQIPEGTKAVFSDCRFPNEAAAILKRGGQIWRIVRPGVEAVNAHPSETALNDHPFDQYIFNNGESMADLHEEVRYHLNLCQPEGVV